MSFEVHPIFDAGHVPSRGMWYAIAPEGSVQVPCPRVGACANFIETGDCGGRVLLSAGATPEGSYSDLYQLSFERDQIKWSSLPSKGLPSRYEHAAFVTSEICGSKSLYVYAGAQAEGPVADIWEYSLGANSWKELKTCGHIPIPRTYHSSSSVCTDPSCKLVVFSGGSTGITPVGDQNIHTFDPKLKMWSTLETSGRPPSPRQGHVAAVVGATLYIHGGMAGEDVLGDLHTLDLNSLKWSCPEVRGSCPPPLAAHGCAVLANVIYVFGGLSPEGPGAMDILYCLHTDTLTWSKVEVSGPPPPARLDHSMCAIRIPLPRTQAESVENTTEKKNVVSEKIEEARTEDGDDVGRSRCGLEEKCDEAKGENDALRVELCTSALKQATGPNSVHSAGTTLRTDVEAEAVPKEEGKFQAITVINPATMEDGSTSLNPESAAIGHEIVVTSEKMSELRLREEKDHGSIPALFVFGGMDTTGHIHGDAFIFIP